MTTIQSLNDQAVATTTPQDNAAKFPEMPAHDAVLWQTLPGKICQEIEPYYEVHPMAIVMRILCHYGIQIGRNAYAQVGATKIYPNLQLLQVGRTSKARKGDVENMINDLFWAVIRNCPGGLIHPVNQLNSVSTGEGLIELIRDPEPSGDDDGEPILRNPNVLLNDSEYGRVLTVKNRTGSITTDTLRDLADSKTLQINTRHSRITATGAHFGTSGSITGEALDALVSYQDVHNGFLNRHLLYATRQTKLIPNPPVFNPTDALVTPLIRAVLHGLTPRNEPIMRTPEAEQIWDAIYRKLAIEKPGKIGALQARGEALALRLSLVFALLDCKDQIEVPHLLAAMDILTYCHATLEYYFAEEEGPSHLQRFINVLLRGENTQGITRQAAMKAAYGHHKGPPPAQIDTLIDSLTTSEHPELETWFVGTPGRSAQMLRWIGVRGEGGFLNAD